MAMATLFDRGQTALVFHLKKSAGRPITYSTAANAVTGRAAVSVSVTEWVGNTKFQKSTAAGETTKEWGERDYLVAVADLHSALATQGLTGNNLLPQTGDRIQDLDSDGVTPIVYEVAPVSGEPCQRISDQTRQVYRIHVKKVQ